MKAIRALFFDLDGTLLDNAGHQESISRTCEKIAAIQPDLDVARLLEANTRVWALYWSEVEDKWTLGVLDGASVNLEAWRHTLRACGDDDESMEQRAAQTHRQLANAADRLFDDAQEVLALAARAQIPLALITNGASDSQRGKLSALDIERWFDAIVISGEIGVAKPDPVVFESALIRLGVGQENVWHVGDNLVTDVAGARAAGLTSVWLNRTRRSRVEGQPEPHMEIRSLSELTPLLAEQLPAAGRA